MEDSTSEWGLIEMGRLNGKVAVITGSGRGIGQGIAVKFAQEGAAVVVCDLDAGPAQETVDMIKNAGGKVALCTGDVTKREDAEKIIKTALDEFGGIDTLVNNAGITMDAILHKMSEKQWDIVVDVSLKGSFLMSRAAAPHIKERGGGTIINFASVAGLMGNPGQTNYSSAKAGNVGLTLSMARELAGDNIRVNVIAPGFINTRMTQEKKEGDTLGIPKELRDAAIAAIPLKRPGEPEDLANMVLFLCSDEGNYLTGQVINMDGGLYMKRFM